MTKHTSCIKSLCYPTDVLAFVFMHVLTETSVTAAGFNHVLYHLNVLSHEQNIRILLVMYSSNCVSSDCPESARTMADTPSSINTPKYDRLYSLLFVSKSGKKVMV
jgi:hypothetical protein